MELRFKILCYFYQVINYLVNVTFTAPKSRVSVAEKRQKTKIITPEATTVKEKLESESQTVTQDEKELDTIEELPGDATIEETINTIDRGNKVEMYSCKQSEMFKIDKGT